MRPLHIALAVLVAFFWGLNFVVIEVGLDHFPPLLFTALRFLVAALPAVFLIGRPQVAFKWILAVGLVLGVAKFGLLFVGMERGMPPGLSSLVLQIQAVFTACIAAVVLGERPGRVRLAGMGVALCGVALAAVDEGGSGPLGAFAIVLAAAFCWGISNVIMRKAAPPDGLRFMVWVSCVPVLPLLALSLVFEGPERDWEALRSLDWAGAGAVVYIAWIVTIFGFGVWGYLLRTYDASTVAPFSLLVPVAGMSSAALFLGEEITGLRWVAALLLVGGVAVTSLGGRRAGRKGGPRDGAVPHRPAVPAQSGGASAPPSGSP
ncbi:EamA family transporter [Streptomyces sp. NBC_01808]|uniref:EamA family transporter n=1 Tax=Streptomyces sp. NBC_01808 TaxID=2975947 RepID=UPI002DDA6C4F|nr:EamA family transporter [Streptomyces sp. NBC_01808]WSA37939.1 EamA family transporter [Streptomyces sp. NBC_01808]